MTEIVAMVTLASITGDEVTYCISAPGTKFTVGGTCKIGGSFIIEHADIIKEQ